MNRIVKLLMISDICVITGFGFMDPILAIFINDKLVGGTIFAAGMAITAFILTKCIVQLPFSRYVDSHDDKVKWLIIGTFMIALVPFIYLFADHVNYIYFAQILHGAGSGLAYPTWLGIWSTNLDKNHESFEWSLYSTMTGLGTATTAAIGAAIAEFMGFSYTFILVGIMAMIGCLVLFKLETETNAYKIEKLNHHKYHQKRKLLQGYRNR